MTKAPWTPEQVAALNRWQNTDHVHPFTCGVCSTNLIATKGGWICCTTNCIYTQGWAHDYMLEAPPKLPGSWTENK